MKKSFLLTGLAGLLLSFLIVGCKETNEVVDAYDITHISEYDSGTKRVLLSYDLDNDIVSQYKFYVRDSFVGKSDVSNTPEAVVCNIDTIRYTMTWASTVGGMRVDNVEAYVNGGLLYSTSYTYDGNGRFCNAIIERAGYERAYVSVAYEESSVKIAETETNTDGTFDTHEYSLPLSSEENTGNVCNVFGFFDTPILKNYVINPDLYYLNIYGKPIDKLPYGEVVKRSSGKLSSVGTYSYSY